MSACLSPLSNPYNFTYTGLVDISAWGGSLLIYPNPVDEILNIDNKNYRCLSMTISDMQGRRLMQSALNNNNNTINLQKLSAGLYLVVLTDNGSKETVSKLILKK